MRIDVKESLECYRFKLLESERTWEESNRLVRLERRMQYFKDPAGRTNIAALRKALVKTAERQCKECNDTVRLINSIKDEQIRYMFHLRYIDGEKWDDIAQILNYDIDSKAVYKIHKRALKTLCDKYGGAN